MTFYEVVNNLFWLEYWEKVTHEPHGDFSDTFSSGTSGRESAITER